MYQVSIQSVNSFKSYRANKLKSTDRHTDRQTHSRKPFFRVQRVSKRGHLTKTGGVPILHKSNTFSDENVKILSQRVIVIVEIDWISNATHVRNLSYMHVAKVTILLLPKVKLSIASSIHCIDFDERIEKKRKGNLIYNAGYNVAYS